MIQVANISVWFLDSVSFFHWTCLAVVALTGVWFHLRPKGGSDEEIDPGDKSLDRIGFLEKLPRALSDKDEIGFSEIPDYVHMQGALLPDGRFGIANPHGPYQFDNEFCWGLILPLFRPTLNKTLDTADGWAYGSHFQNRKRLWEIRYEIHIKKPFEGPLLLGLQGHAYTPITRSTQMMSEVIKAAVKRLMGGTFYYSPGDDPQKVKGERELPICSVPLWAFDQFIETPDGERPPSLTHPKFHTMGQTRGNNLRAFVKRMSELQLRPGPTYTFGFWGISQLFDALKWELQIVARGAGVDFNRFCGGPPVHQVLYTLDKSEDKNDQRHLESRKNYFLRFAFWSSQKPPSKKVIRELIPEQDAHIPRAVSKNLLVQPLTQDVVGASSAAHCSLKQRSCCFGLTN